MTLINLKALLLIFAISISTVYTAQDTNTTCLETKKVDFLLQCHLRYKSLKEDTTLMSQQIVKQKGVINAQKRQISNLGDVVLLKDTIIRKDSVAFKVLAKKYDKSQKKVKRRGYGLLIFGSMDLIFIAIFILTIIL